MESYILLTIVIISYYILYNKEDLYILVYLSLCNHIKSYECEKICNKKYRIAIVTIENRNEDYIKYHDLSVNKYCKQYNYDYIRLDKYQNINVYWSKIFIINDLLKTNKYDYILWLDSDTIICDYSIDINKIINIYGSKDIYIHYENVGFILNHLYNTFNAGMFIIKNSDIGKSFINKLIENYQTIDIDNNNQIISGLWSGKNYEQGIMNLLIKTNEIYKKNTIVLPEYLFNTTFNASLNTNFIDDNLIDDVLGNCFIWHLPGRTSILRSKRFKKIINNTK